MDDDNNDVTTSTTDQPNRHTSTPIMVTQDDDETDVVPNLTAFVTPSPQKDSFDINCHHQEINQTKRRLFPSSNDNCNDESDYIVDYHSQEILNKMFVPQPVESSQLQISEGVAESVAINSKKRTIELLTQSRPGCCADCNLRFNPEERWKKVCGRCYRQRMETIDNERPSQKTSSITNAQQGELSQYEETLDVTLSTDTNSVRRDLNLLTPYRPGCCADCNRRMNTDETWKKVCNQCYRKRMDAERARIKQVKSSNNSNLHNDSTDDSKSKVLELTPSLCIVCHKPTSKKNHQYCLPCYREQETIETSQAQKPTPLPNVVQQPAEFYKMSWRDRIKQRRLYVCIDCGTIVPENWMFQCKICYAKKPIPKSIIDAVNNEKKRIFQYPPRKKLRRG